MKDHNAYVQRLKDILTPKPESRAISLQELAHYFESLAEGFYHLCEVKAGGVYELTETQNEREGGWKGLKCVGKGARGWVSGVGWNNHYKYAYAIWSPDEEGTILGYVDETTPRPVKLAIGYDDSKPGYKQREGIGKDITKMTCSPHVYRIPTRYLKLVEGIESEEALEATVIVKCMVCGHKTTKDHIEIKNHRCQCPNCDVHGYIQVLECSWLKRGK